MSEGPPIQRGVPLAPYTTLKAGGPAEHFAVVRHVDELAVAAMLAQGSGLRTTVLGWGSNVLPSDAGVPGLVILNLTRTIAISPEGDVVADSGAGFQDLFIKTAQAGLRGLEYAVGIPGTVGGALVSNAGAYRSNISEFVTGVEIVEAGIRRWVEPSWMEFSYRDSILRKPNAPQAVVTRIAMRLPQGEPKKVYDEAREYQRQRISKQPPPASAGSFFKNVVDPVLAEAVEGLTPGMRKAGVVPAGFLIEAVGLKGYRRAGAMLGRKHANFMLNVGGATATEIRQLAEHAKIVVFGRFGVTLEEEVLYLGDWTGFSPL